MTDLLVYLSKWHSHKKKKSPQPIRCECSTVAGLQHEHLLYKLSKVRPSLWNNEWVKFLHTYNDAFCLCCASGSIIFQTVYVISLDYTELLLCNSTPLPCDIGYSITEALMGPLICTSFQRCSQAQQTWVGTDVEDVEQNILTGDKQWLDNVWTFFCNISILKEIVFCMSLSLFEFILVLNIWERFHKKFKLFEVLRATVSLFVISLILFQVLNVD